MRTYIQTHIHIDTQIHTRKRTHAGSAHFAPLRGGCLAVVILVTVVVAAMVLVVVVVVVIALPVLAMGMRMSCEHLMVIDGGSSCAGMADARLCGAGAEHERTVRDGRARGRERTRREHRGVAGRSTAAPGHVRGGARANCDQGTRRRSRPG
eukprot:3406231-Rhodomonas_salina.1